MKYWIHLVNFDGFRCDFADNIPDDFWAQAIDSLNNIQPNRQLILLAEGYDVSHLTAGFQMVFGSGFYSGIVSAFQSSTVTTASIFNANTSEYSGVPSGKQRLRYTTNHDESNTATPMTVFGGQAGALAASAITINMGGVPLIYDGQEVGVTAPVPFFKYSSYTPIDWTQNPDMLAVYKTMLAFHNSSVVLQTGGLQTFVDSNVVCYTRSLATDSVLVIANIRNASESFSIPVSLQNSNWTDAYAGTGISLTTTLTLNPYQYYVLKNY